MLKKRMLSDYHQKVAVGIMFVLPAVILLCMFLIWPTIMAFVNSLYNYNMIKPNMKHFIGFENYKFVLTDGTFFNALKNTVYFTLIVVPLQTGLALFLAILINKKTMIHKIFRIGFFSPVITSMLVIAILWTIIYSPDQGLINSFLKSIGLPAQPFLTSPKQAMNSIIFMSAWQACGYFMMIFLAGLQDISAELYEAAQIDGANKWQQFLNVTLPGLSNVLKFVIVMTTIQAFKLFTQPYVMTNGGPLDSTKTIVQLVYEEGFQYRNVGYSSAIAIIFFIMILGVSVILNKFILKDEK